MDTAKIEAGVRLILEGVGEDPEREGLLDTPARVARMYEEVLGGLEEDPARHFDVTFDEGHEEIVLVGDIPFYSMCEHHLAPFFGKAHVAYVPGKDGRICGISKLARLVEQNFFEAMKEENRDPNTNQTEKIIGLLKEKPEMTENLLNLLSMMVS